VLLSDCSSCGGNPIAVAQVTVILGRAAVFLSRLLGLVYKELPHSVKSSQNYLSDCHGQHPVALQHQSACLLRAVPSELAAEKEELKGGGNVDSQANDPLKDKASQ